MSTPTDFIGQRLDDTAALPGQYVKLPSSATAPIRDGRPIGANAAMHLHNNLAHLAHENVRHLAWYEGGAPLAQTTGWSGLRDATPPDAGAPQGVEYEISWSRAVAVHFGPFLGVQDRIGATGAPVLRRVVVDADVTAGLLGSLSVYVALVAGLTPQPPFAGYAYVSKTAVTTGANTITADVLGTLDAAEAIACRPASGTAGAVAYPIWYWVWVGWKSTNAGDRVKAVSVYESRT